MTHPPRRVDADTGNNAVVMRCMRRAAVGLIVTGLVVAAFWVPALGLSTPVAAIGTLVAIAGVGAATLWTVGRALRSGLGAAARQLDATADQLMRAEEAAREGALWRAAVESSSEGLLLLDAHGHVQAFSPALAAMWPQISASGDSLEGIASDALSAWLAAPDGDWSGAVSLNEANFWVSAQTPRSDAGDVIGVVLMVRDLSGSTRRDAILSGLEALDLRADFATDGTMISCNGALAGLLGDADGPDFGDLFWDGGAGQPVLLPHSERADAMLRRIEMLAGDAASLAVDAAIIPVCDPTGKVVRIVFLGRKATQHQSDAKALSERETEWAEERAKTHRSMEDALARLASGDLSGRLAGKLSAADHALEVAFDAAVAHLEAAMVEVQATTSAIAEQSQMIHGTAENMSTRSEQHATTLEETAAALAQITAAVTSAAQGAQEADSVVTEARTYAEDSGTVVREAVAAMSEIETSSDQISRIIGVIDDIAFQTNLLALNAGVEAARAGDAGRGFAVVASEVRALAQRSSDAAREINSLISESGAQVKRGVELVGNAGDALERIVTTVGGIAGHVGDIALSAKEQSTGLDEINAAMSQLDQVTQDNAAGFEQTTSASLALSGEVQALRQALQRLGLSETAAHHTPAAQRSVAKPSAPAQKRPAQTPSFAPATATPAVALAEVALDPLQGAAAIDDDWEDF
ncbi:MAG: methyl-accepting chemotaxis protein [Rhodobacteraceae bacterium]|nr:methyl-accepting chemotaxis protein [Paracoccaceae bacterium]